MAEIDPTSLAACGLDCGACEIRRLPFDPEAAERVVAWYKSQGWLKEEEGVAEALARSMYCHGCLGDRAVHWSADCWILKCCVDEKRLKNCAACHAFPCSRLLAWAEPDRSYREALERLRALRAGREPNRVQCRPASREERDTLLEMMRVELADRIDRILTQMGITWHQFAERYASRGEVRTIVVGDAVAGHCWIETRDRVLHLHAIFVLPGRRGQGIGTAVLAGLEDEFRGRVDSMELGVEQGNARAKSLYLRAGFTVEAARPEIGFEILSRDVRAGGS